MHSTMAPRTPAGLVGAGRERRAVSASPTFEPCECGQRFSPDSQRLDYFRLIWPSDFRESCRRGRRGAGAGAALLHAGRRAAAMGRGRKRLLTQ